MMAPDLRYSRTYKLDRRYAVEFRFDAAAGRLDCLWTPKVPGKARMRTLDGAYTKARHDFLSSLYVPVLCFDAPNTS